MNNKKASVQLEEKLEKLSFNNKAKSWEGFDEKKFEKDAKQVKNTFIEKNETILPKRNYL